MFVPTVAEQLNHNGEHNWNLKFWCLVSPLDQGVQPTAHRPHAARKAVNVAQHKIVNVLKTLFFFFCSSVFVSVCVFIVWSKTTLLPVWPRDAKRLDTLLD